MIERILMPLDGSAASAHTLPYGLALASACHAELTLLHVVVDPMAGLYALPPGMPYAPELASDLKWAGAAILTAERRADLTVMGACGLTARGPLGLGSVTERVLRASATPHLVVNRSLQTVREGRAERGRRAP